MDIRHYWEVDPATQAAIRAAVLLPADPPPVVEPPPPPDTPLDRIYKVLYARDLLIGLEYDNVEGRSDHDCIEAAELEGFHWDGNGWKPD